MVEATKPVEISIPKDVLQNICGLLDEAINPRVTFNRDMACMQKEADTVRVQKILDAKVKLIEFIGPFHKY